jgi:hypothetical protein
VVLTFSRLTEACRQPLYYPGGAEALQYAQFRDQFGVKIGEFPLLAYQLRKLDRISKGLPPALSNFTGISLNCPAA